MVPSPKHMWVESDLNASDWTLTTPTPADLKDFVSKHGVSRLYFDLTAPLISGSLHEQYRLYLAHVKATLGSGVEIWAAVGGTTVDHSPTAYKAASAAALARVQGDSPTLGGHSATQLFKGFALDSEAYNNEPWDKLPNGAWNPSAKQQADYINVISDTRYELHQTVEDLRMLDMAIAAPLMKFNLHVPHWLQVIKSSVTGGPLDAYVFLWPDEISIMTDAVNTTDQQNYSAHAMDTARGCPNLSGYSIGYSYEWPTKTALESSMNDVYTHFKPNHPKLQGCFVYDYAYWNSLHP